MTKNRSEFQPYGLDYTLLLINHGQDLDISDIVIEINWMEDMFGPFARMEVAINDSLGLLDKFPLIGEERLIFTYKNSGPDEKNEFEREYVVYAVTQRKMINHRSHGIVLHAISPAGFKNSLEAVYKKFIKKKPHDIVQEIFSDHLEFGEIVENPKSIITDPAENDYTKIASGVNPLTMINEMANEAKSSKFASLPNGPSSYVFFEGVTTFYFAPIPYFFNQDIVYEYKLGVPNDPDQFEKGKNDYWPGNSIRSISFVNNFDNLDQMHRGAYLNEVNVIDPILKRFKVHPIKEKTKYNFKYDRDFGGLKHLPNSGAKYLVGDDELSPLLAEKLYSTHRRMMTSQIEEDGENYPTIEYLSGRVTGSDPLNAPRKRHEFVCATMHEKANLAAHNIEITVQGVAEIYVGFLVKIKVPQPTQLPGEHSKFLHLYGEESTFLITALRHIYNKGEDSYYTVISASKESFGVTPSRQEFNNDVR